MKNYPFNLYSHYIRERYGKRVQKITVDAGFTCPNRDGTVAHGGCSYCDNHSFAPTHQKGKAIRDQIEHGIQVGKRRYKNVDQYMVYFQSYSNTYAPLSHLKSLYEEALSYPQVVGLSIGTRPDCLSHEKWDYLEELSKRTDLTLELGGESIFDEILVRMNRGHLFHCFEEAVWEAHRRGIKVCAHFILGFPWEPLDAALLTAKKLASLPIPFLKFHQLRVLKGTALGNLYQRSPFKVLTMEEYALQLALIIEHLPSDRILQRLSGQSQGDEDRVLAGHFIHALPEFTLYLAQEMIKKGQHQSRLFLPL